MMGVNFLKDLKSLCSFYVPFSALREKIKEGYSLNDLRADFIAGIIVALIAMPLGMSLSIAIGLPPQYGLYTIIVAGFLIALLGGSKFQVSGPTAAFVAILLPIVQSKGYIGLALCGFIAGIILLIMGFARFGKVVQYIPYPVIIGFTSGIGFVIFSIQIKDFLGLKIANVPIHFLERIGAYLNNIQNISLNETLVGLFTLLALISWRKKRIKFPAPVVIIPLVTLAVYLLNKFIPGFEIATIYNTFSTQINGNIIHGIPNILPSFDLFKIFSQNHIANYFTNTEMFKELILPSFTIALLAVIETLLSAVVADGMTNTKHDSNAEIVALGIGNICCSMFGGIPATGAIARTATNIKFGAKSPIACIVHALFTLLAVIFFAPFISKIPMASLAALLMVVAYDMSEIKRLLRIIKIGSKSDIAVLFTCFSLTVLFDMVVGVTIGLILACLLFIKRMSEITTGDVVEISHINSSFVHIPDDVLVYKITGPLFFGAADKVIDIIDDFAKDIKCVIFIMDTVPSMDISGFISLKNTIKNLRANGKKVAFIGIQKQPLKFFEKADIITANSDVQNYKTLEDAVTSITEPKQPRELQEIMS
jgi:SulP family sulfate permease